MTRRSVCAMIALVLPAFLLQGCDDRVSGEIVMPESVLVEHVGHTGQIFVAPFGQRAIWREVPDEGADSDASDEPGNTSEPDAGSLILTERGCYEEGVSASGHDEEECLYFVATTNRSRWLVLSLISPDEESAPTAGPVYVVLGIMEWPAGESRIGIDLLYWVFPEGETQDADRVAFESRYGLTRDEGEWKISSWSSIETLMSDIASGRVDQHRADKTMLAEFDVVDTRELTCLEASCLYR